MNPLRWIADRAARMAGYERRELKIDQQLLDLRHAMTPNASGIAVTERSAMALAAVFSAINVLATDTASLPLRAYRRRPDGGRDEVRDHPVADLVMNSPDGETTSMRWRQALAGHVLGWGNGYAEIRFRSDGRPGALHLLDPANTRPERTARTNALRYRIDESGRYLPPRRVLHVAGLGYDGLTGYSPIGQARQTIGLGIAAETFGASFFGQGARPGGVIEWDQKFGSEEDIKRFRSDWNSVHQGAENAAKVALLYPGMKYKAISISPEDAQFIATRQFQVIEIARLYRLPPHKIGDYSQSHLANIEASNLDYLTTSLMPWLEAIEQELNRKLFTPEERQAGLYVEHNMAAFLRGDMKARAEFYTKLRDLGVFNPNQIAARENLNPIGPEGDIRLVPGNMVPLGRAGEQMGAMVEPEGPSEEPEADSET